MRVNPWCDSFEFFKKFRTLYLGEKGQGALSVKTSRQHGNIYLITVRGIETDEEAQKMRGKVLFIKRSDASLPEGKFFIAELTGCMVYDFDNREKCYGTLTHVSQTGANDVWHITNDRGEYLIPAIPDVVKETNVKENLVLIRPLKGIFEDED